MVQKRKKTKRILFRVYSNAKGEVFLQLESGGGSVPVARPVTSETLNQAKLNLLVQTRDQLRTEVAEANRQMPLSQTEANKEIEAVLDPFRKGRLLGRAEYVFSFILQRGFTILSSLILITICYKGVTYS